MIAKSVAELQAALVKIMRGAKKPVLASKRLADQEQQRQEDGIHTMDQTKSKPR